MPIMAIARRVSLSISSHSDVSNAYQSRKYRIEEQKPKGKGFRVSALLPAPRPGIVITYRCGSPQKILGKFMERSTRQAHHLFPSNSFEQCVRHVHPSSRPDSNNLGLRDFADLILLRPSTLYRYYCGITVSQKLGPGGLVIHHVCNFIRVIQSYPTKHVIESVIFRLNYLLVYNSVYINNLLSHALEVSVA